MSFLPTNCDCNGGNIPNVVQCVSCPTGGEGDRQSAPQWVEANQRVIQKQVRVPMSQYVGTRAAYNVRGAFTGAYQNNPTAANAYVNWNQASDRAVPSQTVRNVPSHGNSTRRTLTSSRPGAQCAGGASAAGVDVKHNSYERYLLRKKGGAVRQRAKITSSDPATQAYYTQYSIMRNPACNC
jgi:hypothetical protein